MVAAAGGIDVLSRGYESSFRTSWDVVRRLEPELVVLAPCGFDLGRTVAEASRTRFPDLGCPVVAVDGNAYYSRPAPRIGEGVRQLAYLLHPDEFSDPGLPYREFAGSIFETRNLRAPAGR